MIPDGAKELVGNAFVRKAQQAGSIVRPIEAYTPNHNRAESAIRELKRMYRRMMLATNTPQVLWNHAIEYVAMRPRRLS
jgi:3-methyladenine DNA glycosylase Mpg